jgi:hypothetical protein
VGQASRPTIAAKPEELAESGRRRLTRHASAIESASCRLTAVNDTIDKIGSTGGLKAFNRGSEVDPSIRYFNYIQPRKAAMLKASP